MIKAIHFMRRHLHTERSKNKNKPNKAVHPTPTRVTPRALASLVGTSRATGRCGWPWTLGYRIQMRARGNGCPTVNGLRHNEALWRSLYPRMDGLFGSVASVVTRQLNHFCSSKLVRFLIRSRRHRTFQRWSENGTMYNAIIIRNPLDYYQSSTEIPGCEQMNELAFDASL